MGRGQDFFKTFSNDTNTSEHTTNYLNITISWDEANQPHSSTMAEANQLA